MRSRSKKDQTTKTDPRFGPWAPLRGARGQAEALQQKKPAQSKPGNQKAGKDYGYERKY